MIKTLLVIGLGGFIGSIARYSIYHFLAQNYTGDYPWGTFIANMIGCFIIGLIFGLVAQGNALSREVVFFLTVGFCGALTTFSTFSYESFLMFKGGKLFLALIYMGLSYTAGLVLTWIGMSASKVLI